MQILPHPKLEFSFELQLQLVLKDEEAAEKLDIASGTSSKDKANMSAKEIDELLKRGAYDVFREDDTEQREFEEADIESILERRAHKVIKWIWIVYFILLAGFILNLSSPHSRAYHFYHDKIDQEYLGTSALLWESTVKHYTFNF